MKKIFLIFLFICMIFPSVVVAQETVYLEKMVITATRTEETVESVASSVTVITAEEIEKKNATTVAELLREVEGLDVVQSGGAGKTTSLLIRGGNAGHTLVMIDGVKVNSPTLGQYNFSDLTTDNIERIEIIRGPQSTLYGSDAMAGVVNIITKKGSGVPVVTFTEEGGSHETYRNSFSVSGGSKRLNYALFASRLDTEGISAASEHNGNTERDGYENKTISGRFGVEMDELVDLNLAFRYTDAETDLDGFGVDDLNYTQSTRSLLLSADIIHTMNDAWSHTVKGSYSKDEMTGKDPDTAWNNSEINTVIKGADWQHNLFLMDERNKITFGVEYEVQEGENDSAGFDKSLNNRGYYLQDQLSLLSGDLNLTAGGRIDNHSKFGDESTYRVGGSYLIKGIGMRLKGTWGTAFKAPTINDLYYIDGWGNRGNPDLDPEESVSYDIGLEESLLEGKLSFDLLYFSSRYDNLIEWIEYAPWAYEPQNIAEARISGWEFGLKVAPVSHIEIRANCTITDTEDEVTGNELARRPENKGSLSIGWSPENMNLSLTINKVGERWSDADNTEKLDSYTKVDLAFSYDMTKNLTLFGRGENLTNEEYEEVKGYGTAGVSYFGGLKAKF